MRHANCPDNEIHCCGISTTLLIWAEHMERGVRSVPRARIVVGDNCTGTVAAAVVVVGDWICLDNQMD